MKDSKSELLRDLSKELAISGFELEKFMQDSFLEKSLKVLEHDLIKKVSGGRHEKTNADGSTSTTFIKVGPVAY